MQAQVLIASMAAWATCLSHRQQFWRCDDCGRWDGGSISLLSGITFRRVGDGEANTDGLYIAVDENSEWLSGKEGWSVSVSGSGHGVCQR
ncbi:MAG: hypothetical protein R3E63_02265 [Pseudomonadales bacterium]